MGDQLGGARPQSNMGGMGRPAPPQQQSMQFSPQLIAAALGYLQQQQQPQQAYSGGGPMQGQSGFGGAGAAMRSLFQPQQPQQPMQAYGGGMPMPQGGASGIMSGPAQGNLAGAGAAMRSLGLGAGQAAPRDTIWGRTR